MLVIISKHYNKNKFNNNDDDDDDSSIYFYNAQEPQDIIFVDFSGHLTSDIKRYFKT